MPKTYAPHSFNLFFDKGFEKTKKAWDYTGKDGDVSLYNFDKLRDIISVWNTYTKFYVCDDVRASISPDTLSEIANHMEEGHLGAPFKNFIVEIETASNRFTTGAYSDRSATPNEAFITPIGRYADYPKKDIDLDGFSSVNCVAVFEHIDKTTFWASLMGVNYVKDRKPWPTYFPHRYMIDLTDPTRCIGIEQHEFIKEEDWWVAQCRERHEISDYYASDTRARQDGMFRQIYISLLMVVFLCSARGVERETHEAGPGVNKRRERMGLKPLHTHTVLSLDRRLRHLSGKTYKSEGGKVMMRLHWRMGHWRNQAYGPGHKLRKQIWIDSHLVGLDENGIVTHDYFVGGKSDPVSAEHP